MKKVKFFVFLSVLAIFYTFSVSGQKTDFSGSWRIVREKSTLTEFTPTLVRLNIEIKGDSLLTERVYEGGDGQEYPFNENVTLDGIEYSITIYDMPRKAKATWSEPDSALIVETTTTFNGDSGPEDFISKETWKVDKENNTLVINYKNKLSAGESEGAFFFNKAEETK